MVTWKQLFVYRQSYQAGTNYANGGIACRQNARGLEGTTGTDGLCRRKKTDYCAAEAGAAGAEAAASAGSATGAATDTGAATGLARDL